MCGKDFLQIYLSGKIFAEFVQSEYQMLTIKKIHIMWPMQHVLQYGTVDSAGTRKSNVRIDLRLSTENMYRIRL